MRPASSIAALLAVTFWSCAQSPVSSTCGASSWRGVASNAKCFTTHLPGVSKSVEHAASLMEVRCSFSLLPICKTLLQVLLFVRRGEEGDGGEVAQERRQLLLAGRL